MNHKDYIKSKYWVNFNHKYQKSKYKQNCFWCDSNFGLVLHHITYERLSKEELTDVVVLCNKCHKKFHKEYPSLDNVELTNNTNNFIIKERITRNLPELVNSKISLDKIKTMELNFYKNNKEERHRESNIREEISKFKFF